MSKLPETLQEALQEIKRLNLELDICRDAIEVCYNVVEDMPKYDDSDEAVDRCTRRRLNEAVGKAAPRLLYERAGGQKLYGLRWRELNEELDMLRARYANANR